MAHLISYMAPGFPESLFRRIGQALGATVEFESELSGPMPGQNPFADQVGPGPGRRADFGWICSTSYVLLNTDPAAPSPGGAAAGRPSVQLVGVAWVPDDPDVDGRPVYFGDLVTRPGLAISSLADLKGLRVGCNDPVSLSGYYSLRFALEDAGLPADHAQLVFTGGHHRSLDLVASGDLDAAVVDSVVRTTRARANPEIGRLAIAQRLGPWPVQPLVARQSLRPDEVETARRRLLDASADAEMQAELRAASLSHFVEVGRDHYDGVRRALARTGPSFGPATGPATGPVRR